METIFKTAFWAIMLFAISCGGVGEEKYTSTDCCLQNCSDSLLILSIRNKFKDIKVDTNLVGGGFTDTGKLYGISAFNLTTDTLPCEFYKLSDLSELHISFLAKVTQLPYIPYFKSLNYVVYRGFDLSNTEVVIDDRYRSVAALRMIQCNVTKIKFVGKFQNMKYLSFSNNDCQKIRIDESLFSMDSLESLSIGGDVLDYDFSRLRSLNDLIIHCPMTKEKQRALVQRNNKVPYLKIENQSGVYYYKYGKLMKDY